MKAFKFTRISFYLGFISLYLFFVYSIAATSKAPSFVQILHIFTEKEGSVSPSGLAVGKDGYLYGTTSSGGLKGKGTIFKVYPTGGSYIQIHSFTGQDGENPHARLVPGSNDYLYGTTLTGGAYDHGTIFRINLTGTSYETLHSFGANPDGTNPEGPLVLANDGYFYGATPNGGVNDVGTVFKINTTGTSYQVLHSFGANDSDGEWPRGGLTVGRDGYLYGHTEHGGENRKGTLFKIDPNTGAVSTIYSFDKKGGDYPVAGLVLGSDDSLYGTTLFGGEYGYGVIFKFVPTNVSYQLLHSFNGTDGDYPVAKLAQGNDGSLYGMTKLGGDYQLGTLFRFNPTANSYELLHSFVSMEGGYPEGGLVLGSGDHFYGTINGGAHGFGSIFAWF